MKALGAVMALGLCMFVIGFAVGAIVGYTTPKSEAVRGGACCEEYLDHIAAEHDSIYINLLDTTAAFPMGAR